MRIAIYSPASPPIHAYTLEERPLGGTETAIIRLAESLQQRGHDVTVYSLCENPPPSQPRYLPLQAAAQMEPVDVFISVRAWMPALASLPVRKRFYLTQENAKEVQSFGMGDKRVAARLDGVLTVSAWQAETLAQSSGFPLEKIFVLRNGVHLPYFAGSERRLRKRLIYSSTPFRGLQLVPPLFSALRARHPECELHVFSGFKVYAGPDGYVPELERQFQELSAALAREPGIVMRGNVRQAELAREFMRASVLLYPNTYEETSCITAMEAAAAGCVVVTSALGALPETVGDAGILIPGIPGTPEYSSAFVAAANELLGNDELFATLSARGIQQAPQRSWPRIAERFERYCQDVHGL